MREERLRQLLGHVPLCRSDYNDVRGAIDALHAVFSKRTCMPSDFVDAANGVLRVMQFDAELAVRTDFSRNFKGTPFFGADANLAAQFLCAVKSSYESNRTDTVKKRDLEYLVNNIAFDRTILQKNMSDAVYSNTGIH